MEKLQAYCTCFSPGYFDGYGWNYQIEIVIVGVSVIAGETILGDKFSCYAVKTGIASSVL